MSCYASVWTAEMEENFNVYVFHIVVMGLREMSCLLSEEKKKKKPQENIITPEITDFWSRFTAKVAAAK